MGLAASQARLLLLTARKSDLELRAQQITNTEMILAMQTEAIAKEYSNKLSNKTMMLQFSNNQQDGSLTESDMVTADTLDLHGYYLVNKKGQSVSIEEARSQGMFDLQNLIHRGDWIIRSKEGDTPIDINGSSIFYDTYYTQDDAAATAIYEAKTAEIQTKEKQLEIDLKQIENQQKACDTEIDSVKKIIEKNIERTFKTFA